MNIQELFKSIGERFQTTASVKSIYGEPITAEGKTIIPVAKVRYGFGGGSGTAATDSSSEDGERPLPSEGGGVGGGVEVIPVGFIKVTPDETRYVSFENTRRMMKALTLLSLLGIFVWWRRSRQ